MNHASDTEFLLSPLPFLLFSFSLTYLILPSSFAQRDVLLVSLPHQQQFSPLFRLLDFTVHMS